MDSASERLANGKIVANDAPTTPSAPLKNTIKAPAENPVKNNASAKTQAQIQTQTKAQIHTTKAHATTPRPQNLKSAKKHLWAQKWRIFRANKRAMISLYIFIIICALSFSAGIIANDKPLFIYHHGKAFFPMLKAYPETTFGGDFETEANYNDPYVKHLLRDSFIIKAPIPYSYDSIILDLHTPSPTPPDSAHWLGTDDQARDVLARLLYGLRTSIIFGLVLSAFSVAIGVCVGGLQGYYGGLLDLLGQRGIEIYASIPLLFLLIILSSFITPSFWWILLIVLAFSWIALSQVVRAEFLKVRQSTYAKAAKALGVSDSKIIFRHLLPNAMIATITYMPFLMAGSITTLVTLDFLGFGMPVGSASLGELLDQAKNNLTSPHLAFSAFVSVAVLLSVLVFIGEGVRDALDPRAKVAV